MSALLIAAVLLWLRHEKPPEELGSSTGVARPTAPVPAPRPSSSASVEPELSCAARNHSAAVGSPAMLSCDEARQIVAQVRARLPLAHKRPHENVFAEATTDWLDPHGLWSAAPDAPIAARVRELGGSLIDDLEHAPNDGVPCSAALAIGADVKAWVEKLRDVFSTGRERASPLPARRAFHLVAQPAFQDAALLPAHALALELGRRVGAFERSFAGVDASFGALASERFVPRLKASEWERTVLAAAVRAYVSSVDPHGQWAPLDEEWSLYADDRDLSGGPRLWEQMARAAVGVRISDGALPPLRSGDLVLAIDGVATVGLSVEQAEQLSWLDASTEDGPRSVRVLRAGEARPSELRVEAPRETDAETDGLTTERIPYATGSALVIDVPEVTDLLGQQLSDAIREARRAGPLVGVVLDLRGNGGGSTDGAAAAIGVFMPGVPSFPLLSRGGDIEVEHAFSPAQSSVWTGPVAAVVDGYTASAAEMIAGALAAYGRGVVLGSRTFGKGCIQEYFDDRVGAGVLRLTTMLFALPDGSPLQGIGLDPAMHLAIPAVKERESLLEAALPPWRGPDVRAPQSSSWTSWGHHGGRVGPCRDRTLCAALRRLGRSNAAPAPARPVKVSALLPRRSKPRSARKQ